MALLLSAGASSALAQDAPPAPPQNVSGPEISILIRNTIIALNQANLTGNYTVLRDLSASFLQVQNTAADLAAQFVEFRKQRLNLAPTVLFDPVLDEKPALTTDGRLKLVGHFPTKPQEILFDLTYLYEVGSWRIAVISMGSRAASQEPAADAGKPKPKETGQVPEATPVPLPRARPKQ